MTNANTMNTRYTLLDAGGAPIKAWVDGVAFEAEARAQVERVSRLPIVRQVAVMPDVHAGKGATVGSVVATEGAIIPAAVGVDLGCGMMATRTTLNASDLPSDLRGIRDAIEQRVPHGRTNDGGPGDRGAWRDVPPRIARGWAELAPGFAEIVDRCSSI